MVSKVLRTSSASTLLVLRKINLYNIIIACDHQKRAVEATTLVLMELNFTVRKLDWVKKLGW